MFYTFPPPPTLIEKKNQTLPNRFLSLFHKRNSQIVQKIFYVSIFKCLHLLLLYHPAYLYSILLLKTKWRLVSFNGFKLIGVIYILIISLLVFSQSLRYSNQIHLFVNLQLMHKSNRPPTPFKKYKNSNKRRKKYKKQ